MSRANCDRNALTQQRLKELLNYDPTTGIWTWIKGRPGTSVGKVAGKIDDEGYRRINVDRNGYRSARLAFLYMTGAWPIHEADHKNRNRLDDRWENLRDATRSQQEFNKPSTGKIPFKGVVLYKGKKYRARIGKKNKSLGFFDTPEEAYAAYLKAAQELHGEFGGSDASDS
jgi:HNH endonuclease/AP2 domain